MRRSIILVPPVPRGLWFARPPKYILAPGDDALILGGIS
jgi:hypothetical protein